MTAQWRSPVLCGHKIYTEGNCNLSLYKVNQHFHYCTFFPECDGGWFGNGCSKKCHCANNAICDHITGACPERCALGWTGDPTCQEGRPVWHCDQYYVNTVLKNVHLYWIQWFIYEHRVNTFLLCDISESYYQQRISFIPFCIKCFKFMSQMYCHIYIRDVLSHWWKTPSVKLDAFKLEIIYDNKKKIK